MEVEYVKIVRHDDMDCDTNVKNRENIRESGRSRSIDEHLVNRVIEDEDIYEDLYNEIFETKDLDSTPKETKTVPAKLPFLPEIEELKQKNQELQVQIKQLTSKNSELHGNILSLIKTSRHEIRSKNQQISDLNTELQNVLFRRAGRDMKRMDIESILKRCMPRCNYTCLGRPVLTDRDRNKNTSNKRIPDKPSKVETDKQSEAKSRLGSKGSKHERPDCSTEISKSKEELKVDELSKGENSAKYIRNKSKESSEKSVSTNISRQKSLGYQDKGSDNELLPDSRKKSLQHLDLKKSSNEPEASNDAKHISDRTETKQTNQLSVLEKKKPFTPKNKITAPSDVSKSRSRHESEAKALKPETTTGKEKYSVNIKSNKDVAGDSQNKEVIKSVKDKEVGLEHFAGLKELENSAPETTLSLEQDRKQETSETIAVEHEKGSKIDLECYEVLDLSIGKSSNDIKKSVKSPKKTEEDISITKTKRETYQDKKVFESQPSQVFYLNDDSHPTSNEVNGPSKRTNGISEVNQIDKRECFLPETVKDINVKDFRKEDIHKDKTDTKAIENHITTPSAETRCKEITKVINLEPMKNVQNSQGIRENVTKILRSQKDNNVKLDPTLIKVGSSMKDVADKSNELSVKNWIKYIPDRNQSIVESSASKSSVKGLSTGGVDLPSKSSSNQNKNKKHGDTRHDASKSDASECKEKPKKVWPRIISQPRSGQSDDGIKNGNKENIKRNAKSKVSLLFGDEDTDEEKKKSDDLEYCKQKAAGNSKEPSLRCEICKFKFQSRSELRAHSRRKYDCLSKSSKVKDEEAKGSDMKASITTPPKATSASGITARKDARKSTEKSHLPKNKSNKQDCQSKQNSTEVSLPNDKLNKDCDQSKDKSSKVNKDPQGKSSKVIDHPDEKLTKVVDQLEGKSVDIVGRPEEKFSENADQTEEKLTEISSDTELNLAVKSIIPTDDDDDGDDVLLLHLQDDEDDFACEDVSANKDMTDAASKVTEPEVSEADAVPTSTSEKSGKQLASTLISSDEYQCFDSDFRIPKKSKDESADQDKRLRKRSRSLVRSGDRSSRRKYHSPERGKRRDEDRSRGRDRSADRRRRRSNDRLRTGRRRSPPEQRSRRSSRRTHKDDDPPSSKRSRGDSSTTEEKKRLRISRRSQSLSPTRLKDESESLETLEQTRRRLLQRLEEELDTQKVKEAEQRGESKSVDLEEGEVADSDEEVVQRKPKKLLKVETNPQERSEKRVKHLEYQLKSSTTSTTETYENSVKKRKEKPNEISNTVNDQGEETGSDKENARKSQKDVKERERKEGTEVSTQREHETVARASSTEVAAVEGENSMKLTKDYLKNCSDDDINLRILPSKQKLYRKLMAEEKSLKAIIDRERSRSKSKTPSRTSSETEEPKVSPLKLFLRNIGVPNVCSTSSMNAANSAAPPIATKKLDLSNQDNAQLISPSKEIWRDLAMSDSETDSPAKKTECSTLTFASGSVSKPLFSSRVSQSNGLKSSPPCSLVLKKVGCDYVAVEDSSSKHVDPDSAVGISSMLKASLVSFKSTTDRIEPRKRPHVDDRPALVAVNNSSVKDLQSPERKKRKKPILGLAKRPDRIHESFSPELQASVCEPESAQESITLYRASSSETLETPEQGEPGSGRGRSPRHGQLPHSSRVEMDSTKDDGDTPQSEPSSAEPRLSPEQTGNKIEVLATPEDEPKKKKKKKNRLNLGLAAKAPVIVIKSDVAL